MNNSIDDENVWTIISLFLFIKEILALQLTKHSIKNTLDQDGFWKQLIERDFTIQQMSKLKLISSFREYYSRLYLVYSFPYVYPEENGTGTRWNYQFHQNSRVLVLSKYGTDHKNQFLNIIFSGEWSDKANTTLSGYRGVDLVPLNDKAIPQKLQIWSNSDFDHITYEHTRAIIYVFDFRDIISEHSDIPSDLIIDQFIDTSRNTVVPRILVGKGITDPATDPIRKQVREYCWSNNTVYFDVSNENTIESMKLIIRQILRFPPVVPLFRRSRLKQKKESCSMQ
jgi:hypothetical protein